MLGRLLHCDKTRRAFENTREKWKTLAEGGCLLYFSSSRDTELVAYDVNQFFASVISQLQYFQTLRRRLRSYHY